MILEFTIGRAAEAETLVRNVAQRTHTVLLGRGGVGKTHLLLDLQRRLAETDAEMIYVPRPFPAREIAVALYGRLAIAAGVPPRNVTRETRIGDVADWTAQVLASMTLAAPQASDRRIVILLDEADQLASLLVPILEVVADRAVIVAAARKSKETRRLDRFFWRFDEIEVPPLSPHETRDLAAKALETVPGMRFIDERDAAVRRTIIGRLAGDRLSTRAFLVNQLAVLSNGFPEAVVNLAERLKGAERIDERYIREIDPHRAGARTIDGSFILLAVFVLFIALRYLNRGMYDFQMYAFWGAMSGVFLLVRYWMFRLSREPV
jgi:hypothetical protein